MSDLLQAYAEAIESRADTLEYLTAEYKLAAAEVALLELKPYVRKYEIELRRIIKARRAARPGFLRDAEDALLCDKRHDLDESCEEITGWKLFRLRKDGTLGPLFINARQRIPIGVWIDAEAHRTKGFAYRPGWHVCSEKSAPHLSKRGRVWAHVSITDVTRHQRPASQGGLWYTAKRLKVNRVESGRIG